MTYENTPPYGLDLNGYGIEELKETFALGGLDMGQKLWIEVELDRDYVPAEWRVSLRANLISADPSDELSWLERVQDWELGGVCWFMAELIRKIKDREL